MENVTSVETTEMDVAENMNDLHRFIDNIQRYVIVNSVEAMARPMSKLVFIWGDMEQIGREHREAMLHEQTKKDRKKSLKRERSMGLKMDNLGRVLQRCMGMIEKIEGEEEMVKIVTQENYTLAEVYELTKVKNQTNVAKIDEKIEDAYAYKVEEVKLDKELKAFFDTPFQSEELEEEMQVKTILHLQAQDKCMKLLREVDAMKIKTGL